MLKTQKFINRNNNTLLIGIIVVLLIISTILFIINNTFTIKNVIVEGSYHYTDDEIRNFVIGEKDVNSLYLYLQDRYFSDYSIPFIEKIEVDIINRNEVKINVYEKVITGCIEYMGEYLYFDKDGIIVESSTRKAEDIPCVLGLMYDNIILHEKLKIDKEESYNVMLNLIQLIKKYELKTDKIRFTDNGDVILITDNIKVLLGNERFYDEKIANLSAILPDISGTLQGVLDMRDYSSPDDLIVFKED